MVFLSIFTLFTSVFSLWRLGVGGAWVLKGKFVVSRKATLTYFSSVLYFIYKQKIIYQIVQSNHKQQFIVEFID